MLAWVPYFLSGQRQGISDCFRCFTIKDKNLSSRKVPLNPEANTVEKLSETRWPKSKNLCEDFQVEFEASSCRSRRVSQR